MSERSGQVRVSIIIVNWNTKEMTARCLRSVAMEIDQSVTCEYEVIVVDNASADGSVSMLRNDFAWVRLICNEKNVGFARANNQAIAISQGELVLLLNSDTEVLKGAINELVAFMWQHPHAGAAGARLLNEDGSLQVSCRRMLTPERELWRLLYLERVWSRAEYNMRSWDGQSPRQVEVIMGACMMLHKKALDQVGNLDERYFMYTEEVDLCYRLAQAQWDVWYVPSAQVMHYGQASSRKEAEKMFVQLYRSKVQFYRKTGGERTAERFKRLLRLAYWPRLAASKALAPVSTRMSTEAGRYSCLLSELDRM